LLLLLVSLLLPSALLSCFWSGLSLLPLMMMMVLVRSRGALHWRSEQCRALAIDA
jgi:hypothetical protein